MNRKILTALLLPSLLVALSSCGKDDHSAVAVDVTQLSSDVYVSVAQHTLALPFIALEGYASRQQSFSLDRKGDSERFHNAFKKFLHDAEDPKMPLILDSLPVVIKTYGWDSAGMRCPLLTREWARSVCDNPWAAIQQALPSDRFRLVDLSSLQVGDPRGLVNCRNDGKQHRPLPQKMGEAVIVCTAMVYGGPEDQYHHAVVRIGGNLGALWMVWRYGKNGETAEAMTEREGKAIVSFVQYATGKNENFALLKASMCGLRRPGSADGPNGADCERIAKN
jgi:hypothetical protein